MEARIAKQDRVAARVPHDVYETLRQAAEIRGSTISQFLVRSALKEAQAIIEPEQLVPISTHDWAWLLNLLENPPAPNAKLQAAMDCYQQVKSADADSCFNWQP